MGPIRFFKLEFAALAAGLLLAGCAAGGKNLAARGPGPIHRSYTEGEVFKYRLTLEYSETAGKDSVTISDGEGAVKKGADGVFYEEWKWTGTSRDGSAAVLTADALSSRQFLSLDPGYKLSIPDLSKAYQLIEPITDTLTFYADVQLAARKGLLLKAGEQLYVEHGRPNSWAGGPTLKGYDCIDFDLTVTEVDRKAGTATLKALHVPPAHGCAEAPAPWLGVPVAATANNWYQVRRQPDGTYAAGAAKEIFDDVIRLSLADGRILSATQYNELTGESRACRDEQLTDCGAPEKFKIVRKLSLLPSGADNI
ncbi:MAG: hypothetical protein A2016_10890 [Elusimicrobia bacterium GWF2_62_30]|nr:MAG: hypothetical protein A2016_10890 [Elusimicrobia bacterium GWF2_62_30]